MLWHKSGMSTYWVKQVDMKFLFTCLKICSRKATTEINKNNNGEEWLPQK